MPDSAPRHVSNVQQAVDPTEVHERTKVRQIFDDTGANLSDFQGLEELCTCLLALLFDELAPRNNDVHSAFVDLDDLALNFFADELRNIARATNRNLRRWQEHRNTDVDQQAALDLSSDRTRNDMPLFVGGHDPLPTALAIRLTLGKQHESGVVLDQLKEDLDLLPDFHIPGVLKLLHRNDALAFVTNVDDDFVSENIDDRSRNDGVDRKSLDRLVILCSQLFWRSVSNRLFDVRLDLIWIRIETAY